MVVRHLAVSALCASVASLSVTTRAARDTMPVRSMRLASKKSAAVTTTDPPPLLGTLVQVHGGEHLLLDDAEPTEARFEALLADRVTGQEHALDPRLLAMLRDLAHRWPGSRIEILSGYRSEKLNETLRKKGHHVASHSQHTLGHAVDFRVLPEENARAVSPLVIERTLRQDLHWKGGVGVYLSDSDWFTHADVGPNRRWNGL